LIAGDVVIGPDTQVYDFVNLYGCGIGAHCKIGAFVEIHPQPDVAMVKAIKEEFG
jgi:UDP-3-O-[3-hydroxymyristoyl] glucosamine N-acyltransferase